jgi:single-strand DNA-binding protein
MNTSPITLVGNLVVDPELRFVGDGKAKASARMACDRSYKDSSGAWVNESSFFNLVAWGQAAENLARVGSKGVQIIVVGRLDERPFTDKEGNKRSAIEVVADHIGISARSVETFERRRLGEDNKSEASATSRPAQAKKQEPLDEEPF